MLGGLIGWEYVVAVGNSIALQRAEQKALKRFSAPLPNDFRTDAGTLVVIRYTVMAGALAALLAPLLLPSLALPGPAWAYPLAGILVAWLGAVLRFYAMHYLGRFFVIVVTIQRDHQLVTGGPYRYVRHPSYTGSILMNIGVGLAFGNLISLLAMALIPTIGYVRRIKIEEGVLESNFGDSFRAYRSRSRRLVPWVW